MYYAVKIYEFAATLPPDEKYGLTSQIKRTTCSIPLNIAEGAGCESNKEFKLFLEYAHRSIHEVLTALELCMRLKLCEIEAPNSLIKEGKEIRAMVYAFMKKL